MEQITYQYLREKINWGKTPLIPAIIQDFKTQDVLMLAYMSQQSLDASWETGEAIFYSRSRQVLWHKGETSGNRLKIKSIEIDCDADALLIQVSALGPACHTGKMSCFFRKAEYGQQP